MMNLILDFLIEWYVGEKNDFFLDFMFLIAIIYAITHRVWI